MGHGPTTSQIADAPWLACEETRAVLAALQHEGQPARIVGGAVRNALLGRPVKDIDIATPVLPDDIVRLAQGAGLKAVPTGLAHGTVTVVVNQTPFEVTTLRRDVETDGRHATVAFTGDWVEDARRRDFTINALYCDGDGHIHDPLGGLADIAVPRVRFIDDPRDRIREDYLRILRFFRFTAEYTSGEPDAAGLAACTELKSGLDHISAERIRSELLRLMTAPAAVRTLTAMIASGILPQILGSEPDLAAFARAADIEDALGRVPDAVLRLAALAVDRPGDATRLKDRLRLSGLEFDRLSQMAMPERGYDPGTAEREAKAALYRHGADVFRDGLLLAWARSGDPPNHIGRRERLRLIARWPVPELPVRGQDILALGVPSGPLVGVIMSQYEDWWIGEQFPADPERLARELARLVKVTRR
jgi:poly(A) polymerase